MSDLLLLHNPRCSKSRGALEILQQHNIEPTIVRYLDEPLDAKAIAALLIKLGISPRELLRTGEEAYKNLNLADPSVSDAALIAAMTEHPKLIERPIFIAGDRAVIGRPPERVLELLA
ncbi:arsenate reductase (glutaredoxin) [Atopomonas sediminilitoris]|uniref:arsenate reductase (glutaredoxin) n=1 Tax=Atopomonas sediminilitoris TaxID=2919919 RepID=UPI001F4DB635|nr:arsenate reductase (glutaredoxin) [Atopomonas sediminilitoris]MCJ8169285.1 arsenate reductase (glutaredoxin) [Atopomonas sediminilitoris]